MTADQLTERLIELRRKCRIAIEDAQRRQERARALFEELYGLGCGKLHVDSWRDSSTPQDKRDEFIHNLDQHIRHEFYKEAYELIKNWIGVP